MPQTQFAREPAHRETFRGDRVPFEFGGTAVYTVAMKLLFFNTVTYGIVLQECPLLLLRYYPVSFPKIHLLVRSITTVQWERNCRFAGAC